MQKITLGDSLYNARIKSGLKRYEVSAKTGISQEVLISYEIDRLQPMAGHLDAMLKTYGISVETINRQIDGITEPVL